MSYIRPFTPFTGKGLGISQSSLQQIGAIYPLAGFGQAKLQFFVNVNNGNLVFKDRELRQKVANGSLAFYYIYNSQAIEPQKAWRFSLQKGWKQLPVSPPGKTATLLEADGQEIVFSYDPLTQRYFAPSLGDGRAYLEFDQQAQQWLLHDPKSRVTETYNLKGRLEHRKDLEGRTTRFEYANQEGDYQDPVTAMIAPNNVRYEIRRQGNNVGIFLVEGDHTTQLQSYVFDNLHRLIKSYEPNTGYEIGYSYELDSSVLTCVKQSDGSSLLFSTQDTKLSSISMGEAVSRSSALGNKDEPQVYWADDEPSMYTIDYDDAEHPNQQTAVITDPAFLKTTLLLDEQQRITRIEQEQGYNQTPSETIDITQYDYYPQGQLKTIKHPNSGTEHFEYDAVTGLQTVHIQADGQAQKNQLGVGSNWNVVISQIQYADIARTQALTSRYVYDRNWDKKGNAFLRFEISPEGRVIEYRNTDGQGNCNKVLRYIDACYDVAQMDPAEVPSLNDMAQWAKQQDPQRIQLTETTFDSYGQPAITQTYATLTKEGSGISDSHMAEAIYRFDSYGNCLHRQIKQQKDKPLIDMKVYDGLSRELSHTNPLDETTTHVYQDKQSQIIITHPNQQVDKQHYNRAGALTTLEQTAVNEKQPRYYQYANEPTGYCVITKGPDGQSIYTLYDREHRLGFRVTTTGIVTEYRYDAVNRCNTTIHYGKPIDLTAWLPTEQELLPSAEMLSDLLQQEQDPHLNIISYESFDYSGRSRYQVDKDGYVVEKRYDTRSNVTAQIAYDAKLSADDLVQLQQGHVLKLAFDPKKDRCIRHFFDKDKLKIAEQDAAGYITEFKYNSAKHLVQTTRYATKTAIDPDTTNYARPTVSDKDLSHYYFNDNRGQCLLEVNPEGYVTQYRYLACGLKQESIRYAQKVEPHWYQNTSIAPVLPPSAAVLLTTAYEYDELNREIRRTQSDGIEYLMQYDVMGNVIYRAQKDMQQPNSIEPSYQRSTQKRYDGWNQLIQEADVHIAQLLTEAKTPEQKEKVWQDLSLRHTYDPNGLRLKSTSAMGDTLFYYDDEHRPIFTLFSDGCLTGYSFDVFDNLLQEYRYKTLIPFEKRSTLQGGVITQEVSAYFNSLKKPVQDQIKCYKYDKRGNREQSIDAEGYISKKTTNAFGQCAQEKRPLESKDPTLTITHEYDPRGLEITTEKKAGELTVKTAARYDNPYGLESHHTDEDGNTSRKEYDRLGNLTAVIAPQEVLIKAFTHDGLNRVSTETDADGNTTQHQYQPVERTHTIIQALTDCKHTERLSFFGKPLSMIDAYGKEVAKFSYSPDGSLNQEIDSIGNKASKAYNALGWCMEETDKNNSKTAYRYYQDGTLAQAIVDENNLKLTTTYKRDAFGNAEEITDPRKNSIKNSFNKLNQLTQTTQDSGIKESPALVTQQRYNGLGDKTAQIHGDIQNANQFHKIDERDQLGRIIAEVIDPITTENPQGLNLKTSYRLNKAGETIALIDANGNITRKFYDERRRERFIVDANGNVTEKAYNRTGKKAYKRTYLQAVSAEKLSDQTTTAELQSLLKTTNNDSLIYFYYDENGRERFQINHQGAVLEKRYDFNNRLIAEIGYANKIELEAVKNKSLSEIAALVKKQADTNRDSMNSYILNTEGQRQYIIQARQLKAEQPAVGIVTQQTFDGKGSVIISTTYAKPVTLTETILQKTPEQFRQSVTATPKEDSTTYHYFNVFKKPDFIINPEGKATGYSYDENGNQIKVCRYKDFVMDTTDYDQLLTKLKALSPDSSKDQIDEKVYDKANRLIEQKDALKQTIKYERNALNKIKKRTNEANQSWQYDYDRAQRKTKKVSPEVNLTDVEYKDKGLVSSKKRQNIITVYEYDKVGNEIGIIEAAGTVNENKTCKRYDKLNRSAGLCFDKVAVDDANQIASFDKRPEQLIKVETKTIYGAHGKPVVEQDEKGNYTFKSYDSAGQIRFIVNAELYLHEKEYDGLGHVIATIDYATKLELDIAPYTETGIPLDVIEAKRILAPNDQKTLINPNQIDNILATKRSSAFYYQPDKEKADKAVYGTAQAITQHVYNTFDQCTVVRDLNDPKANTWDEKCTWYNRNGKEVAVADTRQSITRMKRDSFNNVIEKVEYVQPLVTSSLADMSLADLDEALTSIVNPKDRTFCYEYDLLNRPKAETQKNVTFQEVALDEKNTSQFKNVTKDLTTLFEYNAHNKIAAITHSDGGKEYKYYNELGLEIARAGKPRRTLNDQGESITLIPFEEYGLNALGDTVMTCKYRKGVSAAIIDVVPIPIDANDAANQITLSILDNHHCELWHQDAERLLVGKTYTATGKLARLWCYANNKLSIDEVRTTYDNLNQEIKSTVLRDSKALKTLQKAYDAFGNCIGKDAGDGKWFYYQKFDALNRCWASNFEDGTDVIKLHDSRSRQTVTLRSPTKQLRTLEYQEIANVLATWSIEDLYRTETIFDGEGNAILKRLPSYRQGDEIIEAQDTFIFDRWHNITSHTNANGKETVYSYNALNQWLQETSPEVEVVTEAGTIEKQKLVNLHACNEFGETIAATNPRNQTTGRVLNEANQLIFEVRADGTRAVTQTVNALSQQVRSYRTNNPEGKTSRYYYNNNGKKCLEINPEGAVTQWQYETNDKECLYRIYINKLDIKQLTDNMCLTDVLNLLQPDKEDLCHHYFYDANGKQRFLVNSHGKVKEKRYNNLGIHCQTIEYTAKFDVAALDKITTEQLAEQMHAKFDPQQDRVNYYLLDVAGRKRFIIKTCQFKPSTAIQGIVSERQYNGLGQLVRSTAYAKSIESLEQFIALTPDEFSEQVIKKIQNPSQDRSVSTYYNSIGKPLFTINANGLVTRYDHNQTSKLIGICKFNRRLPANSDIALAYKTIQSWQPSRENKDRVTIFTKDNLDRTIAITNPNGNTESFALDANGNIRIHTDPENNKWLYHYDVLDRVESEIAPPVNWTKVKLENNKLIAEQIHDKSFETRKEYDQEDNEIKIIEAAGTEEERITHKQYSSSKKLIGTRVEKVAIDDPAAPSSFEHRPEQIKDITTRTIYNSMQQPIVEIDENGQPLFKIYNCENNLLYVVNAKGAVISYSYNSFGNKTGEIRYAIKLGFDLKQYIEIGIPHEVIQQALKNSPDDRQFSYQHNQQGWPIEITEPEIFYYLPDEEGEGKPEYGFASPKHRTYYNVFGEAVLEESLRSPKQNTWTQNWKWRDQLGEIIAEVDAQNAVNIYQHNLFGQEEQRIEYSSMLKNAQTLNMTFESLLSLIDKTPNKDRTYQSIYDAAGQKTHERRIGIVRQKVELTDSGKPKMLDLPAADLEKIYTYNATGLQNSITFEDGSIKYLYHNALGWKIAETGVTFETFNQQGSIDKLTPLTYYGYNAYGKEAMIKRFVNGTDIPQMSYEPPVPKQIDDKNDPCELTFFNKFNLPATKQDAENCLTFYSYTPKQKIGRNEWYLTNWVSKGGTVFEQVRHLDNKRITYDILGQPIKLQIYRNNDLVETTATDYNVFGECINEGPGDGSWPIWKRFDKHGEVISTNQELGACTVMLHDLERQKTAKLQSATRNLAEEMDLPSILTWSHADLEITETKRDSLGRVTRTMLPSYQTVDSSKLEGVPLTLQAGSHPIFGNHCLQWVQPQERNYIYEFWIWPKDHPSLKQHLDKIIYFDNYCGVDVSELETDVYQYQIDYFLRNHDIKDVKGDRQYVTEGTLQFDTGKSQNSYHTVVTVAQDNQLCITGKTNNITSVELWQREQKVAEVPAKKDERTGALSADLSSFNSGRYQVKPVVTDNSSQSLSLPFILYTKEPSEKPLSREINAQVQLLILDSHAQFIWQVPESFKKQPIRIECSYLDENQIKQQYKTIIQPDTVLKRYEDSQGRELICNAEFDKNIFKIETVTVELQVTKDIWLPIMKDAAPLVPIKFSENKAPLKPQVFYGQLPNKQVLIFQEQKIKGDGNCGFNSLGITRQDLIDTLSKLVYDKESRNILRPEIQNALINGHLLPDHLWFHLYNRRNIAHSNLEKAYQEAYKKLPKQQLNALSRLELVLWLENNHQTNEAHKLKLLQQKLVDYDDAIEKYCTSESVYMRYVNTYQKNLWLGCVSALLYARENNITLYIWRQAVNDTTKKVVAETFYDAGSKSKKTVHMLFTDRFTHFNQLQDITNNYKDILFKENSKQLTNKQNVDKIILTTNFVPRTVIHISPAPSIKGNVESLHYLDTSLDRLSCWKQTNFQLLKNESNTSQIAGLAIDVTGMPFGIYPYQFNRSLIPSAISNDMLHEFRVGGVNLYASNSVVSPGEITVRSVRQNQYDRWGNKIREIDSLGNTINYGYNDRNQLSWKELPEVDSYLENGTVIHCKPTTSYGYNFNDINIGKIDANNHTEVFHVNTLGKLLTHVLPDGIWIRRNGYDALERVIFYLDARDKLWCKSYNRLNQVVSLTPPSKKLQQYNYNQLGLRNIEINAAGHCIRYNYDAKNNIINSFQPSGMATIYNHDRNNRVIKTLHPDGTSLIWQRDYFGVAEKYWDLSNTCYIYEYDWKRQVTKQYQIDSHNEHDWFMLHRFNQFAEYDKNYQRSTYLYATRTKTLPRSIVYTYKYGLLTEIHDFACGKKNIYEYDLEKRRSKSVVFASDNTLIASFNTEYDAIGRECRTFNEVIVMDTHYDSIGNTRNLKATLSDSSGKFFYDISHWYRYNENDNTIINNGIIKDGLIQIDIHNGTEYTYLKGLCNQVKFGESDIGDYLFSFPKYDDDGVSIGSESKDGNVTYINDNAGRRVQNITTWYGLSGSQHRTEIVYNDDSWQQAVLSYASYPSHPERLESKTTFFNHTPMGLPRNQIAVAFSESGLDDTTDTIENNYIAFDSWKLAKIGGFRENRWGKTPYSYVELLYDSNGNNNATLREEIFNNQPITEAEVFDTSASGNILAKFSFNKFDDGKWRPPYVRWLGEFYYFYNANDEILGSYGVFDNENLFTLLSEKNFSSKTISKSRAKIDNTFLWMPVFFTPSSFWESRVSSVQYPQTYIVLEGDTFKSISSKIYGDSSFADDIAEYNGLVSNATLAPGQILRIPPNVKKYSNRAGVYKPHYQFLNLVIGEVYPYFDTPHPPEIEHENDDDIFEILFGFIVVGILSIIIPEVAAPLFNALHISNVTACGLAIRAALSNAIVQGVCVSIGMQQNFDLVSMIKSGLIAGLSEKLGLNLKQDSANSTQAAVSIDHLIKYGTINVSEQLVEMAAGLRNQFDPNAVLASMANGLARDLMLSKKHLTNFEYNMVTSVSQPLINSTLGKSNVSTDQIFISAIGTFIGTGLGSSIANAIKNNREDLNSYQKIYAKNASSKQTVEPEPLPAYLHKDYVRLQQQQYKQAQAWLDEMTSDAPLPYLASTSPHSSSHRQQSNTTRSHAWHKRQQREMQETNSDLHWKADYKFPVPNDSDSRFTHWQQQAEQNSANRKWADWTEQTQQMEHWSDGKLYDVKTDTLYEPRSEGGYNVIHDYDNPMAYFFGPVGPELGLAVKSVASAISQTNKLLSKWGLWEEKAKSTRLLSNIERVYSNKINEPFISKHSIAAGWKPPYPENISLREITTGQALKFYRVHVNENQPIGRFLAREKEIAPFLDDPEALRLHLGLPETPVYLTEVNVPANTQLLVGRIGPQPAFGLMNKSGFQYQTIEFLPRSNFINTEAILQPKIMLEKGYS